MSNWTRWITNPSRKLALGGVIFAISASLAIYWLLIVRPTPLLVLYDRPLLDLLRILQSFDPRIQQRLITAFILLAVLYGLGWWFLRRLESGALPAPGHPADRRAAWIAVLAGGAVAAVILLYLYPFDAADIFDNIAHGRILGVYHANPFQAVAADYPQDPFLPYVAWTGSPSAYGPIWEGLAGFTARLAGDGVVENVIAFKLLPGIFVAVSAGFIYLILRKRAPERVLSSVWLLVWNPLVLYETFGHGHNDMVMAVWILAAAWALDRRDFWLAILALLVGGLVKYIPILLIPAAGLIALRELPNAASRVRFIAVTSLLAIVMLAVAYRPFWVGMETLTMDRRAGMFTTSMPSILYQLLSQKLDGKEAGRLVSVGSAGLTGLFALWQAFLAWKDRSWLAFSRASLNILVFYLLVTVLWFQQWYMVWLIGLAALLPPSPGWGLALLLSFAAFAKPFVFGPLVFYWDPSKTKFQTEMRLSWGVMAFSWLAGVAALWKERVALKRREKLDPETVIRRPG